MGGLLAGEKDFIEFRKLLKILGKPISEITPTRRMGSNNVLEDAISGYSRRLLLIKKRVRS